MNGLFMYHYRWYENNSYRCIQYIILDLLHLNILVRRLQQLHQCVKGTISVFFLKKWCGHSSILSRAPEVTYTIYYTLTESFWQEISYTYIDGSISGNGVKLWDLFENPGAVNIAKTTGELQWIPRWHYIL